MWYIVVELQLGYVAVYDKVFGSQQEAQAEFDGQLFKGLYPHTLPESVQIREESALPPVSKRVLFPNVRMAALPRAKRGRNAKVSGV